MTRLPPRLPTRRRFVQGVSAAGAWLGGGWAGHAWGQADAGHAHGATAGLARIAGLAATTHGTAPVLQGDVFDLVIAETAVNFTGRPGVATTVNGHFPGPTLRWREGQTVTLRVTNRLREVASIHWHGIVLPYDMDGVPGISFPGIAPGQTFTYRFKVQQHGTFWYHSHAAMQELTGLYGAIVIDPADPAEDIRADRDHIVQLSDWTDDDPMQVLMNLRTRSDTYNLNRPTVARFLRDARRSGWAAAWDDRRMWNEMRMSATDLSDVSGAVITYLVNGVPPAGQWTALFRPGERVRLRFINAAAHTFYDVRIPGLKLQVVAADGQRVAPVTVDEFRFGPGETYDVIVQPRDDAYTLWAASMDRTGFACGTLAVRAGLQAPRPALEPVPWLSMADMMGAMDHAAHAGGDHAAMGHAPAPGAAASGATLDHAAMNHGAMNHGAAGHGAMDHTGHDAAGHDAAAAPLARPSPVVRHARSEYGPTTDMRVDTPRTTLDDPGVGLRGNGRRVLTLADLHTTGGALDPRGAEREIELHLTGHMERYSWGIDGLEFAQSTPLHFAYGERLRLTLHNDTMMTHPMHLHGLWSELETPAGEFLVRRHTVPVQPAQRVSVLVTADALGRWVWHCHLMFHMEMGMFREVVVS